MKLTFSPASPFARKVRIAAIETGLIDRIEFTPTAVVPGTPNEETYKAWPDGQQERLKPPSPSAPCPRRR